MSSDALGWDEHIDALVQRIHDAGDNIQLLAKVRDELLRTRDGLTGVTTAFFQFVKEKSFRLSGKQWHLLEAWAKEEEARLEVKKEQGEARRRRDLSYIKMRWTSKVVQVYGIADFKQTKMNLLYRCAMRWNRFADFARVASPLLFLRHCESVVQPNPRSKRLIGRRAEFLCDDVKNILSISEEAKEVYGESFTTASVEERWGEIQQWVNGVDGSVILRGQRLDYWHPDPKRRLTYQLDLDENGLLMQKDPHTMQIPSRSTPCDIGVMSPPTSVQPSGPRRLEAAVQTSHSEDEGGIETPLPIRSSDRWASIREGLGRDDDVLSGGTETSSASWPSIESTVIGSAYSKEKPEQTVPLRDISLSISPNGDDRALLVTQDEGSNRPSVGNGMTDEDGDENWVEDGVEDGDGDGDEDGDGDGVGYGDEDGADDEVEHRVEDENGVEHGDEDRVEHGDEDRVEHGDEHMVEHGVEHEVEVADGDGDVDGIEVIHEVVNEAADEAAGARLDDGVDGSDQVRRGDESVLGHTMSNADMDDNDDISSVWSESTSESMGTESELFGTRSLDSTPLSVSEDSLLYAPSEGDSCTSGSTHERFSRSGSPAEFDQRTGPALCWDGSHLWWPQGGTSAVPGSLDTYHPTYAGGFPSEDLDLRNPVLREEANECDAGTLELRQTSHTDTMETMYSPVSNLDARGQMVDAAAESWTRRVLHEPRHIARQATPIAVNPRIPDTRPSMERRWYHLDHPQMQQYLQKAREQALSGGASPLCITRFHWLSQARFATGRSRRDPQTSRGMAASPDQADVHWCSSESFIQAANSGTPFIKPVIIKQNPSDRHLHSIKSLAGALHDGYGDGMVEVQSAGAHEPVSMLTSDFLRLVRSGKGSVTPLNLYGQFRVQEPMITTLRQFQLLDTMMRRAAVSSGAWSRNGSHGSRSFSLSRIETDGAFSGPQVSAFGGKWIKQVVETQLCMFVPPPAMAEEWEAFARDGAHWRPRSRPLLLPLEEGDVVFIPHSHVYALSAVGSCASIEGPVWDDRDTIGYLHWTRWASKNPNCATIPPLPQFAPVLDALQELVRLDVAKYAGKGSCQPFLNRLGEELGAFYQLLHDSAGAGTSSHSTDVNRIGASWVGHLHRGDNDSGPGKRRRLH